MAAPVSGPGSNPGINDQTMNDGITLPQIPIANDLNSAIASVNAMRTVVNTITNRNPLNPSSNDGSGGSGSGGSKGGSTTGKKPPSQGRWTEIGRATEKVKVVNPQDEEQWVEILRINKLTMQDTITGEIWEWVRGGE